MDICEVCLYDLDVLYNECLDGVLSRIEKWLHSDNTAEVENI